MVRRRHQGARVLGTKVSTQRCSGAVQGLCEHLGTLQLPPERVGDFEQRVYGAAEWLQIQALQAEVRLYHILAV